MSASIGRAFVPARRAQFMHTQTIRLRIDARRTGIFADHISVNRIRIEMSIKPAHADIMFCGAEEETV